MNAFFQKCMMILFLYVWVCTSFSDNVVDLKTEGSHCVLFSPYDNVAQALCECIKAEKKRIVVLMYSFTSKIIADELLQAHKRKVDVIIIVNRTCVTDRYNKVEYLASQGIPVFVYDPIFEHKKDTSALMHNKCALFSKNKHDRSIVMTGSFNFTVSADKKNYENVLFISDTSLFKKYNDYAERLKKNCLPIKQWNTQRPLLYNTTYRHAFDADI